MGPKPKSLPPRLGPPPQLSQHVPIVHQKRFEPKMREILVRHAKLIARWMNQNMTWKKILMSWMVIIITSKMVLLMLTYEYFSMTALISLQIFHGVWTIAFFCLNIVDSRAILPNASCLLAGYLPATTVLHILLIPNDYPLHYIIMDALSTFLAIVSMFILLRMECTAILHEAEELWQRQAAESESGDTVSTTSSAELNPYRHHQQQNVLLHQQQRIYQQRNPIVIGGGVGPTVITLDSMGFSSMDIPICGGSNNPFHENVIFDGATDLEPIDFEYFVDEPDMNRNRSENIFRINFGSNGSGSGQSSPNLQGR